MESFQIGEAALLWMEIQFDIANWAVTMFSDEDIGNIFAISLFIVIKLTINKHYDVSVLLNLSGITQVG